MSQLKPFHLISFFHNPSAGLVPEDQRSLVSFMSVKYTRIGSVTDTGSVNFNKYLILSYLRVPPLPSAEVPRDYSKPTPSSYSESYLYLLISQVKSAPLLVNAIIASASVRENELHSDFLYYFKVIPVIDL